jgi:hypothetical protein
LNSNAIDYFNRWSKTPICVEGTSVLAVINALNEHPLSTDTTAQDYVMPPKRYFERAGRLRIYGENQDVFYCFVNLADADFQNPPVYFESSLDLIIDYGIDPKYIIDKDHAIVATSFDKFLWQMLGHQLCLRTERAAYMQSDVCGVLFIHEEHSFSQRFTMMLGNEFFAGYTALFAEDTVVIPDWGAAFLNGDAQARFLATYKPSVTREWA